MPTSTLTTESTDFTTRAYAQALDAADPLAGFRARFHLPTHADGAPVVYLTGNSLGLQPKTAATGPPTAWKATSASRVGGSIITGS
jgi:kynureninase